MGDDTISLYGVLGNNILISYDIIRVVSSSNILSQKRTNYLI